MASVIIQLKDNHFGKTQSGSPRGKLFCRKEKSKSYTQFPYSANADKVMDVSPEGDTLPSYWFKKLQDLASLSVSELREQGIIVLGTAGDDDFEDEKFFYITKDYASTEDSFRLETGNLMGVIRHRDVDNNDCLQIEIGSRFDEGEQQLFLNYLLSKVFDVNLTSPVAIQNNNGIWDMMLALVFLRQFKEAISFGLFRKYIRRDFNDLNFKGKLDLGRHLRNYPLNDRIAYSRWELSYDNPILHLIRHALDHIEKRWPSILANRTEIRAEIQCLRQNTPQYEKHKLRSLLHQRECRTPVKHPLFAEIYEPLRKTSLLVLQDCGVNLFGDRQDSELEGVLFDGAWLWEEYVASILKKQGFIHSNASRGTDGIRVFEGKKYSFYPDFYKEASDAGAAVVLDTKYKFGKVTGGTDDIHQILSYMFLMNAHYGGLIYPPFLPEDIDEVKEAEQIGFEAELSSQFTNGFKRLTIHASLPGKFFWHNFKFNFPDRRIGSDKELFLKRIGEEEKHLIEFAHALHQDNKVSDATL